MMNDGISLLVYGINVTVLTDPLIAEDCYILSDGRNALVVDPSYNPRIPALVKGIAPECITVFLTHEHYDHIAGVNTLRAMYNDKCTVVCSKSCAQRISYPLYNGAKHYVDLFVFKEMAVRKAVNEATNPMYACNADVTFTESSMLTLSGIMCNVSPVGIHSLGSSLLSIGDSVLFSGDALLSSRDILVRVPCRAQRCQTRETVTVFPGHSTSFKTTKESLEHELRRLKCMPLRK